MSVPFCLGWEKKTYNTNKTHFVDSLTEGLQLYKNENLLSNDGLCNSLLCLETKQQNISQVVKKIQR